jgi:hypothetical protein
VPHYFHVGTDRNFRFGSKRFLGRAAFGLRGQKGLGRQSIAENEKFS